MACIFGIDANTMKQNVEVNPFIIMWQKVFDASAARGLQIVCRAMWPALFYGLGFKLFDEQISDYFLKIITEAYKSREKNGSTRNDFIDLLSDWKKSSYITSDSISDSKSGKMKIVKTAVNDEMLVGQLLSLFGAGYETTSTTMTLVLYELAKNKQIQDGIDYESVNEMPYLEACVQETLRLYPIFGLLTREVMEEYTLSTGLHLQKATRIHIRVPVHHIHREEKYFENPEVFRPERFLGEERQNIRPFTFLPFGEGPRACIGLRLAKMPIHVGLLTIFRNYRLKLSENIPRTLQFKPTSLVLSTTSDVHLQFIPRHDVQLNNKRIE